MARILVVDDSLSIREMVGELLLSMGHEVYHASDGHNALQEVQKRVVVPADTRAHPLDL